MTAIRERLHWLIGLRVTIVTLMLGLSLVFEATKAGRVETFYGLIILTYIVSISSAVLLRKLTTTHALSKFFWAQIAIDFLLETVLVARSGGVESPFVVLYIVTVAVASLIPHRRVGLLAACGCIILLGVVTNVQLYGFIEPWGWLQQTQLTAAETFQTFGVYALALLIVGLLSGTLADQLQQANQTLREKEQGLTRLQLFHENVVQSISSGVFTTDGRGLITSFYP
ncbi:hypothetical protein, partial [Petrachloros mirabilis]